MRTQTVSIRWIKEGSFPFLGMKMGSVLGFGFGFSGFGPCVLLDLSKNIRDVNASVWSKSTRNR